MTQGRRTFRTAIGEFLVIVVGILCALGAQAFWEYRVERREERESLLALREELSASRTSLLYGAGQQRGYADASRRLLDWTGPDPSLPGLDTVAAVLEDAISGYSTYNDHRGVLDGLIASGGLRLIQNDSLRSMLAGWPAVIEDLTEDEVLAIDFRNRELLPYLYQRLPRQGGPFRRDLRSLFTDPYFDRLIYWRIRQLEAAILSAYGTALAEVDGILAVLDEELGARRHASVEVRTDPTGGPPDSRDQPPGSVAPPPASLGGAPPSEGGEGPP